MILSSLSYNIIHLSTFSLFLISLFIISVIVFPNIAFSQKFEDVEIKSAKLSDDVYVITGKGGNLGLLIGKDGNILIDDQFAPLTNKILDVIHNLTNQPIKFLINTHWHPDHTGGNENFGKLGSLIISHENVRERLSTEQFIEFMERKIKPLPVEALPIITFTDSISFHIKNETVQIFHFPNAHTDGDSMIYFKENNILHTGDIFVKNRYPFIDTSSHGTIDGIIGALEKIIPLLNKESLIIPGHGDISNLTDLYEYLSMLQDVRNNISSQINKGYSIKQILESNPTSPFDHKYGNDKFITPNDFVISVFQSLQ